MVSLISVEKQLHARRHARFHVQLEIEEVSERGPGPGWAGVALVKGRVRRIFRADQSLQVGSAAHFEVSVYSDGDRPSHMGEDIFLERDCVAPKKHAEVILNGDPPLCRLISFMTIDAPSRRARLFIPNRLQWWWIKLAAKRRLGWSDLGLD